MKSNRICSESLKKLIIKRFESGKSSDELFFHVMIFFGCVAVSHAILALYVYNEAFYKIMSLAFVFFSYIIMPIIFYHIPFAWNFFPKYKIFVNIEDIQYYDELSKIFDFNCAYTKQVILNKNINFIKNKIANNGYLDGGSINNLIDEIILLKKKTDEDKKIEEEKNIAEQKKQK